MTRRRFSAKSLVEWLLSHDGRCAHCGWKVGGAAGMVRDHIIPLEMGGDDTLENMQPLCRPCDRAKTRQDQGHIAKAKRMNQREAGIRKQPRHPLPGSKASGWRKPFNGPPVRRE